MIIPCLNEEQGIEKVLRRMPPFVDDVIVVDNGYSAATGGQDIPSSFQPHDNRSTQNPIEKAVRGVGVNWVKSITRTYDVAKMRDMLKEALTTPDKGPKVIIAQSECMLNKQRRIRPLLRKLVGEGKMSFFDFHS